MTDFWGVYNAVACALRQGCLVHLLRDLMHVKKQIDRPGLTAFCREAQAADRRCDSFVATQSRTATREVRLAAGAFQSSPRRHMSTPWTNKETRRLIKRLRRHQHELFTLLDREGVPFENNHAEREIRPAVIIRKNSYGNRSQAGANCQTVLMTVFRTLKKHAHSPVVTITKALRTYLQTGKLPPLPDESLQMA